MKTELAFLLDLLLNHKLPTPTKQLIAERMTEVEAMLSAPIPQVQATLQRAIDNVKDPFMASQCASTQALLAKHPDLAPTPNMPGNTVPLEQIAKTQAAAQALASRSEAIAAAVSGKVDKSRTSPKKW